MRPKMMPPIPPTDESEHDRFKRFAKAILSVPKAQIPTAEVALSKLQNEKSAIENKMAAVRRELKKRQLDHHK